MVGRSLRALGARAWGLLALLFVLFQAPSALADSGRPVGWEVSEASESLRVGKVVMYYDPELKQDAHALAKQIPRWWQAVEDGLSSQDLDDELDITFVKHAGRVAEATAMPRWVSGVAHPPSGEIAIARFGPDGAPTDLESLLRHEMVHVGLYRAAGGAPVPRWFHEGVADSVGDEINLLRAERLAAAVFGPGVPEREALSKAFRGEEHEVTLAYAASRDLVTYLRYQDPDATQFKALLDRLEHGHGFEAAVLSSYGETLDELEERWRSGLFSRFAWYPILGSGSLPLILACPVLVVGWVRRRREYLAGLARLERQDARDNLRYLH